jgi:hypothetical protein
MIAVQLSIMIFPNDWADILIVNFISSKLLPVANYPFGA